MRKPGSVRAFPDLVGDTNVGHLENEALGSALQGQRNVSARLVVADGAATASRQAPALVGAWRRSSAMRSRTREPTCTLMRPRAPPTNTTIARMRTQVVTRMRATWLSTVGGSGASRASVVNASRIHVDFDLGQPDGALGGGTQDLEAGPNPRDKFGHPEGLGQ